MDFPPKFKPKYLSQIKQNLTKFLLRTDLRRTIAKLATNAKGSLILLLESEFLFKKRNRKLNS